LCKFESEFQKYVWSGDGGIFDLPTLFWRADLGDGPGITRLINLYFKNLAKSALKYSHLKLVALLFDNVMAKIKTTIKNFTRNRSRSLRPFSSHSDPWHMACTRLNFWETGESIISCGIKRLEAMNPPYNWKIILLKKR
jgi:hypothetical protein